MKQVNERQQPEVRDLDKTLRCARRRLGFTLIEVVFTIALTGFLFIALWGMISTNVSLVAMVRDNETATQLLTEKFETIRLYNWDQINSNSYLETTFYFPTNGTPRFTGTVSVIQAPIDEAYRSNLLQVTVKVDWTGNRRPQSREMVSYVSKYGIQRLISGN
jgi:type II secretory pathway pseudopilin PulG